MNQWLTKYGVLCLCIVVLSLSIWAKSDQDDKSLLDEAYESVKETYGDFYIPSKMIDLVDLEALYGVSSQDVDTFIAESAMMTSHVDVFIGIKAKKGKSDAVSESLERYRLKLFEENGSDAAKMAKIEASKVLRFGEYVFFMVLGQNTDAVVSDETVFLDQAALEIERGRSVLARLFK